MSNLSLAFDNLPVESVREFISDIEMQVKEMPQVEIPAIHHFANPGSDKGIYTRTIELQKGALIVGKIHKFETVNIVSRGEVWVVSQDGKMKIQAGGIFVSTPGAKRVIYAHEDATWTCIHATGETDLEKIEAEFIAKDYTEIEMKESLKCLG